MSKFYLEPTKVTPKVVFDHQNGIFELKGVWSPENSLSLYHQIMKQLDQFIDKNPPILVANLSFLYFNASCSKCLFGLLKRCARLKSTGVSLTVNWFYEETDEAMKEVGEEFSDILNIPFNFIGERPAA